MKSVDCKHHWVVPTSGMPEVISTCKLCGKNKRMVNEWAKVIDDLYLELGVLGGQKEIVSRKLKYGVEHAEEMDEE